MELNSLTAISPIDGRYRQQVEFLDEYFSEFALMKYRVLVEIKYFFFLAENGFFSLNEAAKEQLQKVAEEFSVKDAAQIKDIEKITNHDVKAVEYFLKDQLEKAGGGEAKEWIHFGLTSQDINNTSIPLAWKACIEHEYLPALLNLKNSLHELAVQWKQVPMLAKTHGQPASPTTLGKEIMVFVERLQNQIELFSYVPFAAKFGGATGNFNAHQVAYRRGTG